MGRIGLMASSRNSRRASAFAMQSAARRAATGCTASRPMRPTVPLGGRGAKRRKTFATLGDAKAWRARGIVATADGLLASCRRPHPPRTAEALIDGMERGACARARAAVYKPSVVRSYSSCLRLRLLPCTRRTQARRYHAARRAAARGRVARRRQRTPAPSATRSCRCASSSAARFRTASSRSRRASGLRLPRVPKDAAIASPASRRLASCSPRSLCATARSTRLRSSPACGSGELRALRWRDVDLEAGASTSSARWMAWGPPSRRRAGRASASSRSSTREFGDLLSEHHGTSRVCPTTTSSPARARRIPSARRPSIGGFAPPGGTQGLDPINLHEARHTFASTAIAAGLNAKVIATYMGHSSIQVTYDLYGKLMPGNEAEAAALFEAYLSRVPT